MSKRANQTKVPERNHTESMLGYCGDESSLLLSAAAMPMHKLSLCFSLITLNIVQIWITGLNNHLYTSIIQSELVLMLELQERQGKKVVRECFILDLNAVQDQH